MADKKLNTGLSAEEVIHAFTRALLAMTADETRAEIEQQVAAERLARTQTETSLLAGIATINAELAGNYVNRNDFAALKQRVAALEEGNSNA